MKIENMDFNELNTNIKLATSKEIVWKPNLSDEFLDHCLPVLASIPLVQNRAGKIDTKLIMDKMNTNDTFTTPNGSITGHNLRYLISFLYKCPRGDLIPGAQTKFSTLAALTPLVLYANRLYNNIAYSAWDKNSYNMPLFLGYKLQPILEVKENPSLDTETILELRNIALAYGAGAKKAGQLAPITGYKMNLKEIDNVKYPMVAMMMYLQVWLANSGIRKPESMILDPVDWDRTPEAVDQTSQYMPEASPAQFDQTI